MRPFVLKGLAGVQPSGTYSVETHNEQIGSLCFLRAERTSTWIRICWNSGK
jgi:hypothetical protein